MSVQPADTSRPFARTFAVLLAITMVPMFVGPSDALIRFTSSTQDTAIVDAWGAGAPFGTWGKTLESAKFYFHGDPGCGNGAAPAIVTTCGGSVPGGVPAGPPIQPHWWLDTRASINTAPQQVILYPINQVPAGAGQTLDFDNDNCLYNRMQVMDETTLTGFDVEIDAQLTRELDDTLRVWVSHLKADCTPIDPEEPYIAEFDVTTSTMGGGGVAGRGGFAHYTGSFKFISFGGTFDPLQPYGVVMQKGERLRVSIGLISNNVDPLTQSVGGDSAIVAFDGGTGMGSQSFFTVHSDSIRVNQWTANRHGEVTNHFPHTEAAHPADVADRTIHWSATAFDTWGHEDDDFTPGATGADPDPYLHCNFSNFAGGDPRERPVGNCRKDNLDEQNMRLRVKDVTPGHPGFDQYVPLDVGLGLTVWDSSGNQGTTYDTSFIGCCDSDFINPMKNKHQENDGLANLQGRTKDVDRVAGVSHFEFRLVYAQDFLDGVYQIEFQESGKLWRFATQFVVGSTGFTFKFADDESIITPDETSVKHTVALGEATKYSLIVRNTGSVADNFGFAIPVPGNGWKGTVTPNTASLAPGAEIEVSALIEPPSTVRAGDIKVVAVAATSLQTNSVKTLYTITTYTTDRNPQTPYLTSPITEINTRPQLPTNFPLVLHNPGPVLDNYVVTSTIDPGAPTCPSEGFIVVINPTYLPVYAASREGMSVRVVPPTQAPPGCSYVVHFKACRTLSDAAGTLCSPNLDIPVRIFLVDNVKVNALTNRIEMRDVEMDQYEVDCPVEGGSEGIGLGPSTSIGATPPPPVPTSTGAGADASCTYIVKAQDLFFDDGALFRILVENNGDREDRIELSGGWAPAAMQTAGWDDVGECEGSRPFEGDGVPDGWRYRLLPASPLGTPGAGLAGAGAPPLDPGMVYPQPAAGGPAPAPRWHDNMGAPWASWEGPYNGGSVQSGVQAFDGAQHGAGASTTFAGEGRFGWLTLPPRTAQWVYVELFWVAPQSDEEPTNGQDTSGLDPGCALEDRTAVPGYTGSPGATNENIASDNHPKKFRVTRPSDWATFRLSYRSNNDDSLRGSLLLTTHLTGRSADDDPAMDLTIDGTGNDPVNMNHRVKVELGIGQPVDGLAPSNGWATYNVVATNTGNEYDDLLISVDNGLNGWRHEIVHVLNSQPVNQIQGTGIIPSGDYDDNAYILGDPTPFPATGPGTPRFTGGSHARGCDMIGSTGQKMTCYGIGVYDTVYFQVKAIPPSGAAVGSYDDMAITVESGRFSKQVVNANPLNTPVQQDHVNVRSFVQGTFGFALLHNNDRLLAYRGQTIAFPFTIRNVGTTNDVYKLFIDPADVEYYRAWNPQLSATSPLLANIESANPTTPALVGVPSGYDFHGFVSLTIPVDELTSPITDPDFVDPAPDIRALRLAIFSTQNPLGQSGVIDFFPVVTETPEATMTIEETSIAGGTDLDVNAGRMRITTIGEGTFVLYDGYYLAAPSNAGVGGQPALPTGFRFVCLPPTHANFDVDRKCYDPWAPTLDAPCAGCTVPYLVEPRFHSGNEAIQQLEVHVPDKQLGTSRIAHRVQGILNGCTLVQPGNTNGCIVTYADGVIDMESTYGVDLQVRCDDPDHPEVGFASEAQCIIPPGTPGTSADSGPAVLFELDVGNTGLAPQNVLIQPHLDPGLQAAGWQVFMGGATVHAQPPGYALADHVVECPLLVDVCTPLNPLTHYRTSIGLVAPRDAKSGDTATIIVTGTVQEDPTLVKQVVLRAVVGAYGMNLEIAPPVEWVAPQDFARFPVLVTNSDADNALFDVIKIQAFMPGSVTGAFPTSWDQNNCDNGSPDLPPEAGVPDPNEPAVCYVMLEKGESRSLRVNVVIPEGVAPTKSGPGYPVTVSAHSVFRPAAAASVPATIKVLDYVRADVDGDLLYEYAVDGCTTVSQLEGCNANASDGYETFRENAQPVGTVVTRPLYGQPDLEGFLNAQGRAYWRDAATGKLDYDVDIDGDKRIDHFLDTDNDGLPDMAWLPSVGRVQALDFKRDVTADQLPDYFIDLEGDGPWDYMFDLALGRGYALIQHYVDEDGILDYVIDLNGNGIDEGDTILYGGPGGVIRSIRFTADVDGNGILDHAIDIDGDGNPDHFLAGNEDGTFSTKGIAIVMRDVTGDNVPDWTYDHTGNNGRPDQYYDPVTGKAGEIDSKGAFLRDLESYWFILLLFLVALALFVVLVVVTRKR